MHVTCGSGSSSSSSSGGSVGRSVGRFLEKQPLSLFVPWATYYFLSTASAAVAAALMMVQCWFRVQKELHWWHGSGGDDPLVVGRLSVRPSGKRFGGGLE